MMKDIIPINAPQRHVDLKATVLETRVVVGAGGGPEKTIINTPRFMDPYGYKTYCAYMRAPNDTVFQTLVERAEKLACPILPVDDRGMFDFGVSRRMLKLCREYDVKIWHGHDYKSNLIGWRLRRWHPMKLVTTVHGWVHNTWKTPLYYALDRWSLRHYDHVICVSNDLYEQCLKLGISKERCSLIENAIDTEQYHRSVSVSEAKKQLGFPEDRFVIGGVGRLSPEKNFAGLIRVVAKLIDAGLPLSLYIAGSGAIQAQLQQQIDATGHGDYIRLFGYCNDMPAFYQALDLFVLNSLREGLPNVVLEAMAYELPVLSTRVAGVPQLITNGYNGVLIDIQDENELEQKLQLLVNDPDYCRMIGDNGHLTVKQKYSFGLRMKKIRDIYDRLMAP